MLCSNLAITEAFAAELKVGVLKYGTVNWLMDTIEHHRLDVKHGFKLQRLQLASKNATSVALLSGEVDSIVTDWLWALRERKLGEDVLFFPYSVNLGAVMVKDDSHIRSLVDLSGKSIGVAGGPLDKSWLLLRARMNELNINDLEKPSKPVFAAPPLLSEQLRAGRLDAVLTYWHFAARLEGDGYRRLIGIEKIMQDLGIESVVPMIGFVFRRDVFYQDPELVNGFIRAIGAAQRIMFNSDKEWLRLRPIMGALSDAQFKALVRYFRSGILSDWGAQLQNEARKLFTFLAQLGGEKLIGKDVTFDPDIFLMIPDDNEHTQNPTDG